MKKGFTLIEILIGLSVSSAIFIVATSLVANIFGSTTKNKQNLELEQVKNDLRVEFGNTVRWADTITFTNAQLQVDTLRYALINGKIEKNGTPLTPDEVEITKFEVSKFTSEISDSSEGSGAGLNGQYFDNDNFTGLAFAQNDFTVDFNWGVGSPDELINENTFSARYTGQVEAPENGEITFYTNSDEGARLWVNNSLIIDDWAIPGPAERSGRISLVKGTRYDLRLDYYENFGPANLSLLWSYAGVGKRVVPTQNLFPTGGAASIQILVEMRHKNSISVVSTLKIILSPRSGNISTIESE